MNKNNLLFVPVLLFLFSTGQATEDFAQCDPQTVVRWQHGGEVDFGQVVPEGDELTPDDINQPRAITVDSNGNIYVGDSVNYRILKFDALGKLIQKISLQKKVVTRGKKFPLGYVIKDMTVDKHDNLYVINLLEYRVEIYSSDGRFVKSISYLNDRLGDQVDRKAGVMYQPERVAVDYDGTIYIFKDIFTKRPQGGIYSTDGNLLKRDISIKDLDKKIVGDNKYNLEIREERVAGKRGLVNYFLILKDKSGKVLKKCGPVNVELPSKQHVDQDGNVYCFEYNTLNIIKIRMLNK